MIEMRPSKPEELSRQRELWKLAFGDSDGYIDLFYQTAAGPEDVLVLLEDGVVYSMLALPAVELTLPDGDTASSAYVYALATDPAARGRGYGRMLLRYVDFYLRERGVDCVTVVPAEESLHKFFASVDFAECFTASWTDLPAGEIGAPAPGDAIEAADAAAYDALRERLLEGAFHVRYGGGLLAFQAGVSRLSGAGLYRLRVDGREGCAAAEYDGSRLILKELLLPPGLQGRGLALVKERLPAGTYQARGPYSASELGEARSFGMLKWLNAVFGLKWRGAGDGYLGLAFD